MECFGDEFKLILGAKKRLAGTRGVSLHLSVMVS